MGKSRRRTTEKIPKGIVKHKAHRRNVKHKIKLGYFDTLPEVPHKTASEENLERGSYANQTKRESTETFD